MLSMYLGKMEEAVYYPPVYFDNRYEDEWITDKQSVEIIRDVDKSDVVSAHLIEGPVLGPISPKELSGGVKTVLLMLFDETGRIFNACIRYILPEPDLHLPNEKNHTLNLNLQQLFFPALSAKHFHQNISYTCIKNSSCLIK